MTNKNTPVRSLNIEPVQEAEEHLMYVGGDPNAKEDTKKEEWQKKWDKIVRGEATFKELGDSFTEGDIEKLRTAPPGRVDGFSKSLDKMRSLVVHVGYSKEEIESEPFKNYMKRTKTEIENLFGKKNIEVGFHVPDEETPDISSYGFAHMVCGDAQECAVLKRRLQKDNGPIDFIDVRVNPVAAGKDYFGLGGEVATTPGPVMTGEGEYKLPYKAIVEHEMMHVISAHGRQYNPTSLGDGYYRSLYDAESRSIHGGHHAEFIPEKEGKPGEPIAGGNKTMKKVLKVAQPKDKNVYMVDKDGSKHKLLVINPEKNIMNGSFTNENRAEALKNGTYITKAQRIAVNDLVKDYLIGEKRREAAKGTKVKKPKLVVNNGDKKTGKNKAAAMQAALAAAKQR